MTQQGKGMWKQLAIRENFWSLQSVTLENIEFGPFNSILLLSITGVHYK